MKILVIHGAGMNMRGKAQVEIFGPMTLPEYDAGIRASAEELGIEVEIFHSNIEGEVINRLFAAHDEGIAGAIINPAGFHARLSGPGRRHRQRRLSDDRGPYLQSGAARRRFGRGDELSRHRVRLRHRRLRARPARTEGPGESLKRVRLLLTHVPLARRQYYGARALARLQELVEVVLHEGEAPLDPQGVIAAGPGRRFHHRRPRHAGAGRDLRRPARASVVMRSAIDIRNIDVAAASQAGVLVTQAEAGFVQSVVELTLGFLVDLSRGVSRAAADYHAGRMPEIKVGRQLGGSTVGIIGYGRISRALAPMLAAAWRHGAGVRSLCASRRPALRQAAARRSAGTRRLRGLPRHRQRGDREPDGRGGLRAHEAGRLLHQHVARQPGRRDGARPGT